MTNEPNPTQADLAYDNLQTMTQRANVVREGIHLLDVCFHDLRVMVKFFKDHNADIPDIAAQTATLQALLTDKSDSYETWLNSEQMKIDSLMRKLGMKE